MKYLTLIFLALLILLPSVSALDSLGTFKQGDTIRIAQVCSDATYVNISSIAFPNSQNATGTIAMTNLGNGEFYYLFNQTTQLGRYDVRGISDGCEQTFATYFDVNSFGSSNNQIPIQLIFLLIGFILIGVGKITDKLRLFKFVGSVLVMIIGVLTLYPGYNGINYSNLLGLSVGMVSIGVGFFFMIEDSFSQDKQVKSYDEYDDGRYY